MYRYLFLLALLASISVSATAHSEPGDYTCQTVSPSGEFEIHATQNSEYHSSALRGAIRQCREYAGTDQGLCEYNATCEQGWPFTWARCSTTYVLNGKEVVDHSAESGLQAAIKLLYNRCHEASRFAPCKALVNLELSCVVDHPASTGTN